jgi:prepilin-type N-terminal cleavage/methylation domain-containing protein
LALSGSCGRKGYTLIELLVVIAIMGIIASIAVTRYQDVLATVRGSRILNDLRAIDSAIVVARASKGIDVPDGAITADLPAELIPEFLAKGPVPSYGLTIIDGGSLFTVPDGTAYAITLQRATINGKTVEQVISAKGI